MGYEENSTPKSLLPAITSCLAYSAMSNCMILANRYLLGSKYFGFEQKTFVVFIQAVVAVLVLEVAKKQKVITYDDFNTKKAKQWSPVTILFVLMLYTSTQATANLPIHIVVVFKNVTNIAIVFGEWKLFNEPGSKLVVASLCVMLMGAIMASKSDVESGNSSMIGYFWMLMNCSCTAGYILYMRYATSRKDLKLTKFGMAFYNNLISSLLLLPGMLLSGDLFSVWGTQQFQNLNFLILLFLSGVAGVGLNLASFWCVSVTSATTYATVGALNKLPTTFVGVLILNEPLTPSTAMYVLFGMTGGILYGYAKFKERQVALAQREMEQEAEQLVANKA